MINAHATLAPSSASRWVACPGSVKMQALYPQENTDASNEGTAAHWAASEMLSGRVVALGQVAENGVTLSDEMLEAAQLYVDTVSAIMVERHIAAHIEEQVTMPLIHEQNWGTPDAWLYDPSDRTVFIFDFKYGHRYVDVFENWQLVNYASGILSQLEINGIDDQATTVIFCIVQPRSYHSDGPVRTWECRASDLRPLFNKLTYAAGRAMQDDNLTTPSSECRDCTARHACPALQKAAYIAADQSLASEPIDLTGNALGLELRVLERAKARLDARISGLQEQTLTRVKRGEAIPFYRAEASSGRLAWNKPEREVLALGKLFGAQLGKTSLVTPTQAVKCGIPFDVIASYCEAPKRGLKLVEDDNSAARKIFAK